MPLVHMADSFFAEFAQAVAPAAVAALWQGAAVAIALVLCLRLAPRVSAAHRFAAWSAGFAVVACLPLLPLLAHFPAANAGPSLSAAAARPWLQLDSRWGFAIAALWLAATAFRAAELAVQMLRLRRLWKGSTLVEAGAALRSLLAANRTARPIEVCTTRELDRPSVIGFFKPRILIPEWLYLRLTPSELEQVVLHEAEHLRRRDDWTNLLQKLLLVFFPLNPALAWMERRLCREREMACDEGVVRRTQAPRAYAACLTALAERGLQQRELMRRAQALSLGAFERRPELVNRVHSILRRKQALHPLAAGALVAVVGCGLIAGSVALARSPQLVAFDAAPSPDPEIAVNIVPQAGTAIMNTTGADSRSLAHFRAIQARAILPARRDESVAPAAPARSTEAPAAITQEANADGVRPRAQLVKAVAQDAVIDADQSQSYVVLTAWEEVQTSSPNAGTVADYDTGANEQSPTGATTATASPDPNPGAQITITRLIFLVYSADSLAQSHPTSGFHSHRHAASSLENGWLVFKL